MALETARHLFTIEELYRMVRSGVLSEDARIELIRGDVIEMTPIGSQHNAYVNRLNRLLQREVGDKLIVQVQGSVRLSAHDMPQPDVALLRFRADYYGESLPGPAEVALVVEVSDTTLQYDREVKLPLYARAGIAEVWLVDINRQTITVYSEPVLTGYRSEQEAIGGDILQSAAVPGLAVAVDAVTGRSPP